MNLSSFSSVYIKQLKTTVSVLSLSLLLAIMLCASCAEHQEYLLESGDGSQVVCEHQLKISDDTECSAAPSSSSSYMPAVVEERSNDAATTTTTSRKRKFLTSDRFAELASVKLRRKIAPIKKWRQLKERIPFAVLQIHSMEVASTNKKRKQTSFYAELQTEDGEMFNVWITEIIRQELLKYDLEHGDVYIMALGMATSKSTGHEYHNFAVVQDN